LPLVPEPRGISPSADPSQALSRRPRSHGRPEGLSRKRWARRHSPLRASFCPCPQRAAHRNRPTKMHKNRHIEKAQPRAVAIQGIQASYDLGGSAPALSRSKDAVARHREPHDARCLPDLRGKPPAQRPQPVEVRSGRRSFRHAKSVAAACGQKLGKAVSVGRMADHPPPALPPSTRGRPRRPQARSRR
jgi:hypothetical protein